MKKAQLKSIIRQGEGIKVEFKECRNNLSGNVFETVCAFLNRSGGELLFGVSDNREITGIDKKYAGKIKMDFVAAMNNPQKISPSFYLLAEEIVIDGKTILYVYVPESSQVHRCNGRIFDRNEDGDFDITDNHNLVASLYIRKQTTYSENQVFPYAELADLRKDIIERVRKQASINRENHTWKTMDDFDLLKSAQLFKKDYQTGKDGFTLAALLLFGKDETILSVTPHFRIDAILRRENKDRYDDRDDIRTNLIDSYDRLVNFGEKHLNDPFYMENDKRVSLRGIILREVISNLIIHREYSNAFPAKFVIEREKLYAENSNKPHGLGMIDPSHFSPYPKNPSIARVFKEIGRADELGSGVKNLFKYCRAYCGHDPQLMEEDVFKFILPLTPQHEPVSEPVNEPVKINKLQNAILEIISKNPNITKEELESAVKKSRATITRNIARLKESGLLVRKGSDKAGYWNVKKIK